MYGPDGLDVSGGLTWNERQVAMHLSALQQRRLQAEWHAAMRHYRQRLAVLEQTDPEAYRLLTTPIDELRKAAPVE